MNKPPSLPSDQTIVVRSNFDHLHLFMTLTLALTLTLTLTLNISMASKPSSNDTSRVPTPNPRFTTQASTAADLLASQTVGLVHLSDFRKRRAEALEQKEREAQGTAVSFGRFAPASSSASGNSVSDVNNSIINGTVFQLPMDSHRKRNGSTWPRENCRLG